MDLELLRSVIAVVAALEFVGVLTEPYSGGSRTAILRKGFLLWLVGVGGGFTDGQTPD